MAGRSSPEELQREKVWDPVSRVWHWLFAVAVAANWTIGTYMTFDTVQLHFYVGYSILALLAFRVAWGFLGPAPIRFGTFLPSPSGLGRYVVKVWRREPSGMPGHNPLGALSVYAMLLVVASQALAGLFIEADPFFRAAPLNDYVPDGVSDFLSAVHHTLPGVILALVILHIAAVFFYLLWKREDLIRPMIHGWKWVRRK